MLHDISNHVQHPFNIVTKNPYQYKKQNKNSDSTSDTSTLNETDSWTDEEWAAAYAEAEVRVTQLSTVVVVKTSMNNMGLF